MEFTDAVFTAEQLTKRYPGRGRPALDAVDLRVRRGSRTALVGPNAAGKSTLIRCLIGFENPSAGRVTVMGDEPIHKRGAVLGRVAYVPQNPRLYDSLTVADHVALAGSLRRNLDRMAAAARIRRLGIPSQAKGRELSGGEQVQVVLAIAMAVDVDLLLLDEPLASLDPLQRRDLLELLREDTAHGRSLLLSSHLVGELESVCDDIIILGAGHVLLQSSIEHALSHHAIGTPSEAGERIGRVRDNQGREAWLSRVGGITLSPHRNARLEEIVLGYLERSRSAEDQHQSPAV